VGIPLSQSPEAKACLGGILGNLEQEKPAMDNFTRDEAAYLCRQFATSVFDKANEEDRMGLASKSTARNFYAASTFLTILEQFESEVLEEDQKRIVYAKWKSTDILKAINEGRTPTAGAYGEDEEAAAEENVDNDEPLQEEVGGEGQDNAPIDEEAVAEKNSPVVETVSDNDDEEDFLPPPVPKIPPSPKIAYPLDEKDETGPKVQPLSPPPAYPNFNLEDDEQSDIDLPPAIPAPPPYVPPSKPRSGISGLGAAKTQKASKVQMADAVELTRFALAALEDKDAELGANRLQQALRALGRK
jgi:vacuolar protein sorting-associated protein VTA1